MIAAAQTTLHDPPEFEKIRIEADAHSAIIRIGEKTVHVNRADLAAFCLCQSGTLGGTAAEDPLTFKPGEEHGSRKPCKHIRAAWSLAPILWSLGSRYRVSDEPLVRSFWREYDRQNERDRRRAISKAISQGIELAQQRLISDYCDGKREFSIKIIADLEIPELETQRWKSAVVARLVSSGWLVKTERSIAQGGQTQSLIKIYVPGPVLVRCCGGIEQEARQ